jgi:peroxiredoxin Q/BCP|tara:strand:+ start:316 stop:447 length:132 start_codon:yes stop_codon:yes gene_type:complete
MLKTGSMAPEFQLSDQDGNIVNISDYVGQKVLLWFYPKASTPG